MARWKQTRGRHALRLVRWAAARVAGVALVLLPLAVGAAATVVVIDRPTLRVESPLVPGPVLSAGLGLAVLAAVLRWGMPSLGGRGRWAARGVVGVRLAAVGVLTGLLVLLGARPVDGSQCEITFHPSEKAGDPNLPTRADQLWADAVRAHRRAVAEGRRVRFDSPELEWLIAGAAGETPRPDERTAFVRELWGLDPLNERLAGTAARLADRRGDRVVVISYRVPDGAVRPWPIHPGRVESQWVNPAGAGREVKADRPKVVMLRVTHDVAVEAVLEVTIELPTPFGFPTLEVQFLVGNNPVGPPKVVPPPARDANWWESSGPENSFGRYGDRATYRVRLPRAGDAVRLKLSGPGWEPENPVPQFSGEPIRLPPRVAVVRVTGGSVAPLTALDPFKKVATDPPLVFDPPPPVPPGATEVRWVAGPLTTPPAFAEPTVEVVTDETAAGGRGRAVLVRGTGYLESDLPAVWVQPATAVGHPLWGLAGENNDGRPAGARVHVSAVRKGDAGKQEGDAVRAVVFQRRPAERPGWVTVVVPATAKVGEWYPELHRMVGHLLVYATSLAGRVGRSQAIATTEVFLPADAALAPPVETGEAPPRAPLTRQVADVLRGRYDDRTADHAANHIGGELLRWAAAVLGALLAAGLAVTVVRTVRSRRAPDGTRP